MVRDREALVNLARKEGVALRPGEGYGRALTKLFDLLVEAHLQQPTFILGYPLETSPLSRKSDTTRRWWTASSCSSPAGR